MTRTVGRFALSSLLVLAGCRVLEPRQDTTRTFVLSASGPVQAPREPSTAVVMSVGPVRLPDYLLRPEVVRRANENELEPSAIERWAEPIDAAVLRVLCLDLAARLPQCTVVPFPTPPSEAIALRVEVEIDGFEGSRGGSVRLDAHWTLRDQRSASSIVRSSKLERAAGDEGTPATVAAMSALLGELADEITAEVRK
jgi:uncharacterized lipoprotein YmbA